jgi:glycosyltransferase involved in cell wall biosynthesis
MQVCDAVVLASENETFGLVLAEAMLAGVAVIGTNSGGVTEIIKNQETGLMFEPGDSDGLASCIRMLATDSEFKKNIAENGREKARGAFDHAEHYEKLRSLMATRGINKES